jgi:hypothetical protein
MQKDSGHATCSKKIELLILTREEDFREINMKMADMLRLLSMKIDAQARRIVALEESIARFRHNPRCMSS